MARVIGSEAGGYATVQPTENYLGQAIQNQEANAFKYREEQRAKEAKAAALAKAKADNLAKQAEDDLKDADRLDAIRAKDSGISGIDSAVVNGMAGERQKYIEATQKYKDTGDKKYLIERSTAMNNLQSIANIPTSYQKAVDAIGQGITNGTLDRSEEKRITDLGDKIEKGFVVPKIQNGVMTFDVFERDPETGKLSSIAIKNLKGEELINQLTPQKKFDYIKHIADVQNLAGNSTTSVVNGMEITGYPNADKFATQQANNLLKDPNLLHDVAQKYNIEEDPKSGYSPEDQKKIYDRYHADIVAGLNTGKRKDYEAERLALQRDQERRQQAKDAKEAGEGDDAINVGVQATNFDPALGKKVKPGTYKVSFNALPKSNVKGVTFDPKSRTWTIYEQNLKSNALTPAGIAKVIRNRAQTNEDLVEEMDPNLDYLNPENATRAINSKANYTDFNQAIRTLKKPNSKEGYGSFEQFYNVNAPAIKAAHQSVLASQRGKAKPKPATAKTKPATKGNYSNVTETQKGTIGYKNGKWYDIKTGKEIK